MPGDPQHAKCLVRAQSQPDTSGMRASWNGLADDDRGVRASDAERDQAIGQLRDRFAEGLLSQETFLLPGGRGAAGQGQVRPVRPLRRPAEAAAGAGQAGTLPAGRRQAARITGRAGARPKRNGPTGPLALSQQPELPPLWLPPSDDRRFTIGRAMACDFTLADLSVSRWHARLYRKGDDWLLSDLGSTNGTRLNGWRVTTGVPVRPGDQVSFGSVMFVISDRTVGASQADAH